MQILTFLLGEEKFAIDVSLVDTIENKTAITTVPKSKKCVIGLISNRESILPVINTHLLLNQNDEINDFEKLIIVNIENEKLAIAVDDVDDVILIEESNIEVIDKSNNFSVVNFDSNIITLLTYEQLKKI
jgi:purine-binding chemotaxis protein CheW